MKKALPLLLSLLLAGCSASTAASTPSASASADPNLPQYIERANELVSQGRYYAAQQYVGSTVGNEVQTDEQFNRVQAYYYYLRTICGAETETTYYDQDGKATSRNKMEYDSDGREIKTEVYLYSTEDGTEYVSSVNDIVYDENGNETAYTYSYYTEDGAFNSGYEVIYELDSDGRIVKMSAYHIDADGEKTLDSYLTSEYDSNGILSKRVNYDADGKETSCEAYANEVDSNGLLTHVITNNCDTGATVTDVTAEYNSDERIVKNTHVGSSEDIYGSYYDVYEYDSNLNLLSIHEYADSTGGTDYKLHWQAINTYDPNGNMLTEVRSNDQDASGTLTAFVDNAYELNEGGLPVKKTDNVENTYTLYEYDEFQNCTKETCYEMDGTVLRSVEHVFTKLK